MLKPAIMFAPQLEQKLWEISDDIRFQFAYAQSYRERFVPIDNTWNGSQFVSLVGDEITGFMKYNTDRDSNTAFGLQIINFTLAPNTVFAKDLMTFLRNIFEKYKHRKLKFTCYADNPIIGSYERLCNKLGGRVVGRFVKEDKLLDGEFHDMVLFEILREDYLARQVRV